MSYVSLGRMLSTPAPSGESVTLSPEYREKIRLSGEAGRICTALAKSGALPSPSTGKAQAVYGTVEFTECERRAIEQLRAGKSPSEVTEKLVASSVGGPNYLLWAGVGAAVLIGGALVFTKKKSG